MLVLVCVVMAQFVSAMNFHPTTTLAQAQSDPKGAFEAFISHFARKYVPGSPEYQYRFDLFYANVQLIASHNSNKAYTFKLALNEFADYTTEEFLESRTGFRSSDNVAGRIGMSDEDREEYRPRGESFKGMFKPAGNAPEAHDWRTRGAVSPVKDQGSCGSCWAFSAIGAVEGINAIQTGEMVRLSEQELVDCMTPNSPEGCCFGCNGGLMDPAFDYIHSNGGIDTEDDYQYWGAWSWQCNNLKRDDRHVVTISGYMDIPAADEEALQAAVAQQPVAVAICASTLQFYFSGIINHCCDGLNHGVLVVGYGADETSGQQYWVVKNSWGDNWGEKGYFLLERNTGGEGMCGVASVASIPVKDEPNPPASTIPDICYNPIGFGWKECYQPDECCCRLSFFGLFCLWEGCCEGAADVAVSSIVAES